MKDPVVHSNVLTALAAVVLLGTSIRYSLPSSRAVRFRRKAMTLALWVPVCIIVASLLYTFPGLGQPMNYSARVVNLGILCGVIALVGHVGIEVQDVWITRRAQRHQSPQN